jgi:hypothetical protein
MAMSRDRDDPRRLAPIVVVAATVGRQLRVTLAV